MDYALEKGITYLDTAEWYGNGMSERIIGNWIRERNCRDRITVLTKFFPPNATTWGNREYIRQALDASLSRLQSDYVDIYMMHFPDPNVPIEETLSTLSEEAEADGCAPWGAAISTPTNWRRCWKQAQWADIKVSRSTSRSTTWSCHLARKSMSLTTFTTQWDYMNSKTRYFLIANGRTSPARYTARWGGGFLSGQYARGAPPPESSRAVGNRTYVDRRFRERNFRILDNLQTKAGELGISVYNLAMAWAMAHPRGDFDHYGSANTGAHRQCAGGLGNTPRPRPES